MERANSYFSQNADGQVTNTQSGVVRTNCMDNLDRTNVVQSLFGRRSLLLQLNEVAALKGNILNSPFDSFEHVFKRVWGNNADAISIFYAGTGALKTDFTRTGKRTKKGALMDGYNSCVRYIKNNFMDGHRQDVVDLLLGRYEVSRSKPSPFRQEREQNESVESLLVKLMGLVMAFLLLETVRAGSSNTFFLDRLVRAICWTLLVCIGMFSMTVKKGNSLGQRLVRLPVLRPQDGCMTTWKNRALEHRSSSWSFTSPSPTATSIKMLTRAVRATRAAATARRTVVRSVHSTAVQASISRGELAWCDVYGMDYEQLVLEAQEEAPLLTQAPVLAPSSPVPSNTTSAAASVDIWSVVFGTASTSK
ncbi:TPA: hypothetical protein N0F65_012307 [Lagenidium giganteum]|uniref:SAC domain-containing protein n=1 Tax=Lagenidium giganteum TaxID=4803 RepID=A0AAV2YF74_9STRA|nr:TPA: hypothetical protein N0F65_012307 [Lagenidium giganteum]